MKVSLSSNFKVLKEFDSIELPKMTVLTGLNGSGKSQFLDGLKNQSIRCDLFGPLMSLSPASGTRPKSMHPEVTLLQNTNVDVGNFSGNFTSKLGERFGAQPTPSVIRPRIQYGFASTRTRFLQVLSDRLSDLIGKDIVKSHEDIWRLGREELANRADIANDDASFGLISAIFEEAENALSLDQNRSDSTDNEFLNDIDAVKSELHITRLEVTEKMISSMKSRMIIEMFKPNIVEIFGTYRDLIAGNDLDELQSKRGFATKFLDQREFVEQYGPPPWEEMTKLLLAMGLTLEVKPPSQDMRIPVSFRLRLVDTESQLTFDDLSSGERVLLQFAFSVMRPNPSIFGLRRPKLLLLDEMDASLHPEMVQRWLSAIERGIVGELGISVVLTTHSPTTVALAPEDAIFAMIDGRPQRVSKQAAINRLTFGVPTLSIDYSGRRQIFCESDTDAAIYERIYASIKTRLSLSKELNFIGTGVRDKGKLIKDGLGIEINAGEAVVRKIVENLSSLEVNSVYGLIDWDSRAVSSDKICVVGSGIYYSIENILLDPLLIGMLMVIDRLPVPNLNLKARALETISADEIQNLANFVQNSVNFADDEMSFIDVHYIGGQSIKIRKQYVSINGHDLENLLTTKFPSMKKYTSNRGALSRRISDVVISDFPEFCPIVIGKAFEQVSAC